MANDKIELSVIRNHLDELSTEYFEFHPSEVPIVRGAPTAFQFLRKWLFRNVPVIFKYAISHWPAVEKWDEEYLIDKLKGQKISVSVTPDGYADAVKGKRFMLPEERIISFDEFSDTLSNPQPDIFYIQKQNNNLMTEFGTLLSDLESDIPWATKAIGKSPDAVNFWMGDERSVTSLHKDNYENIYCVVKGRKEFILHPPVDCPWIPYESFQVGTYRRLEHTWAIDDISGEVKWIPINPLCPNYDRYPLYRKVHTLRCSVEEGDVLYLPSLWYHHVRQTNGCIAVNYWYDMDFDSKYCNFKFLEKLGELLHSAV